MSRNTIDSATQAKFMYLFERISEPIYFGPRGQGDNKVLYVTPLDRLAPNVARAVVELRKGIPLDQVKTIDVSYSTVPYDLSKVQVVPKDAIFSPFCQFHFDAAQSLMKVFSDQKSLSDFFSTACFCRDEVNSHLWLYSLSRAIILRPDMKGFKLPAVWEIMPDRFLNSNILREARRQARLPQTDRSIVVVDRSFTGIDLNPEHKVAYWREDIAINSAHWIWHVVYPLDAPLGQRDRKGELFFKMHHDMVGRYDAERLAHGLSRTVPFDIFKMVIDEGYFSKLTLENSSENWGTRQPNTELQNINRMMDPKNRFTLALDQLKVWLQRLYAAIDQGIAITPTGQTISLANDKGIDVLGAMVEASLISPNFNYYGTFHNAGHLLMAYCVDPDYRFKENPGLMSTTETGVRDPVFFRWHRFVDDIFLRHKATLPAYSVDNLVWPGVIVTNFIMQTEDRMPNTLVTFMEQRDVDLSRGLDFQRTSFNNLGPILARFTHLQHEAFSYRIEANNATGQPQIGTVRIFMAPLLDENQLQLTLNQQQRMFFEMDKFTVSLKPGSNIFERGSQDSSVTIPWDQSFEDLERKTQNPTAEQVICGCGWPQHLLLPIGNAKGQPFDVFVIITNWEQDKVRRKNPMNSSTSLTENCKASVSFCGILNELFPDTKPMGYPFDRVPRLDPNGQVFNYLSDWLIPNSNMKTTQVDIVHRDVVVLADGAAQNLPVITQGQSALESKYVTGKKSGDIIPRPGGPHFQQRPGIHGDWVDLGDKTDYSRRAPRDSTADPYEAGRGVQHLY